MAQSRRRTPKSEVHLYVYDLAPDQNAYASKVGLGAYHSGVVVYSREYTFGQGGCVTHAPGGAAEQGATFREKILLGETTKSSSDVDSIYHEMNRSSEWAGDAYDVLRKNCNSFSDAFSKRVLGSRKSVMPAWVNRSAGIGKFFQDMFKGGGASGADPADGAAAAASDTGGFQAFQGSGTTLGGTPGSPSAATPPARKKRGWGLFSWGRKKAEPEPQEPEDPDAERRRIAEARLKRFGGQ